MNIDIGKIRNTGVFINNFSKKYFKSKKWFVVLLFFLAITIYVILPALVIGSLVK